MNFKIKSVAVILLTTVLLIIISSLSAYAYIGSIFTFTYNGQTISYKVLREPTETENGEAQIIGANSINQNLTGQVIIPSTVTNQRMVYNVTVIEKNAFQDAKGITSITLPNTVKVIEEGAFKNCTSLTRIGIPKGVTRLEDSIFEGCSSLTEVTLPEGLTYVGNDSFRGCGSLRNINLPKGITYLGDRAFEDCNRLSGINLPEGLLYLGINVFYNCNDLLGIHLPQGINYIGAGAFYGCSSLKEIQIPEGIESIPDRMFQECTGLMNVSLPEGLKRIGRNAFYKCSNLKDIHLPDDINQMETNAFYQCTSLTKIKLPYGITKIADSTFYGCSSLEKIRIQDQVTSIGDYAFYKCSNLISIDLPDGVTSIGVKAFTGCVSMRPIKIPSGVTSIGYGEYPYCGVFVYKNSYAETYFQANYPKYYQIVDLPLEEMVFSESIINIGYGDMVQKMPSFYPKYASDITEDIQWRSSKPWVVTVANGTIKGLMYGEADITAKMGSFSASYHVIVSETTVNPTSIAFAKNKIEVNSGESLRLQLDFIPLQTNNKMITWTSSDQSVVSIEDGRIYAKSPGTVTIKAASALVSAECTVTVTNPLKEIYSDYDKIIVNKGETRNIAITFNPMNTTDDKTTSWRSEDESVVYVNDGMITAVKPGITSVIASVGAFTHRIPIEVQNPATSLSLAKSELSLTIGQTQTFPITILPADTTDELTITSSDPTIAVYSNGSITAKRRGKTTISITCGSFSADCDVIVNTDINSISLNYNSIKLYLGNEKNLSVTLSPTNIVDSKDITWVSSDPSVVTVTSSGKVVTVGTGTASVTATAGGSKTAICSVVVKLAKPSAFHVASAGYNSVKISWGEVSGAYRYRVYRATSKTGSYERIKTTKTLSYTDTGLTTSKTYYYKVRAYRYQGTKKVFSSYTSVLSTKPILNTPGNVKLSKISSSMIRFTWDMESEASGYEIYRSSSKNNTFSLVKTTTSLHYINYGLTKGRTYYYKVRTYKIVGKKKVYSKFSAVFSVKI